MATGPKNPSKFTEERRQGIYKSLRRRIPHAILAPANGIHEDTFYDWLNRGLDDLENGQDTEYARFSEQVKSIEHERVGEHLDTLATASERWQAHAWILERRWWKHFSPRTAEIEVNDRIEKLEKANKHGAQNVESKL